MKLTYQEHVQKINNLDKDEIALILIKAMESILSIDKAVNLVIKNISSTNNSAKNVAYSILDEYRTLNNYIYFEKEFKKVCGFDQDDELIGDILFEFLNKDENKNIEELKENLLESLKEIHSSK